MSSSFPPCPYPGSPSSSYFFLIHTRAKPSAKRKNRPTISFLFFLNRLVLILPLRWKAVYMAAPAGGEDVGSRVVVVSSGGALWIGCVGRGRRGAGESGPHEERVLRLLISAPATALPAAAATASTPFATVAAAAPVAPAPSAPAVAALSLVAAGSVALDLVETIIGIGRSVISLLLELARRNQCEIIKEGKRKKKSLPEAGGQAARPPMTGCCLPLPESPSSQSQSLWGCGVPSPSPHATH